MLYLLLGLALLIGSHSLRLYGEQWRTARIEQLGEGPWKSMYSLVSIAGFVLMVIGYAETRATPITVWEPAVWTRHLAALLTLPVFVLVLAAYLPGSHLKSRIGHPMLLGTKFWALAHLIANGSLADLLLFGSFLAWAVALFVKSRRRDRLNGVTYPATSIASDLIAVIGGLALWVAFAFDLHLRLIGVAPFGNL